MAAVSCCKNGGDYVGNVDIGLVFGLEMLDVRHRPALWLPARQLIFPPGFLDDERTECITAIASTGQMRLVYTEVLEPSFNNFCLGRQQGHSGGMGRRMEPLCGS